MPDIAALAINLEEFGPQIHVFDCPADCLQQIPHIAEKIAIAGFPDNKSKPGDSPCTRPVRLIESFSEYNHKKSDHFRVRVNDGPGMSGAPVYDEDNQLLGVYAGHDDNNLKYVFGARYLMQLL